MATKKNILFLAILLIVSIHAYCQTYGFRHYEVEAGLSNNAVICTTQDKAGFMWFGTRDGLNRFDGHSFKVYRFPENNFIHALHVDPSGNLLVGTEKNIFKYNAGQDSFTLVASTKNYPIDEIKCDADGNIWFNAGTVLSCYSQKTKKLKTYPAKDYFWATGISIDSNGFLWVSTPDGFLKKYDKGTDTFTGYDMFSHNIPGEWRFISNIKCISNSKILIGTTKANLKIFDSATNTYEDIILCCEKMENLFVHSFLQVNPNEVWIGTETGIFSYNMQTGVSFKIKKNSSDEFAVSDNVTYSLFKDREGGIWVGTYFGGINYFPKQYTPFQRMYQNSSENSISGNIVREITKDDFGNLWIIIEDGGLNKLEAKTNKMVHFKPDGTRNSISYIGVHSLLAVNNELWVGTFEHGLDILDIKTGKVIRHYDSFSPNGFGSNFPFCFHKTNDGQVLLGSFPGIFSYDKNNDKFIPLPGFPPQGNYRCILKDSYGTIWAGVPGKGVFYANSKTGRKGNFAYSTKNELGICNDMVNAIFEDSHKNLWFATENGLCKLNRSKNNFTRYGVQNGFPSNFILSMLEDENGRLWISTTKGLVCFDVLKNKTVVYTTANGLLSDQFNFSSAFKDIDNKMYFGSAKGLVSFYPKDFTQDTFIPPVYLTGLQIDNKEVAIAPKDSPLKQSISHTEKITLRYNQSTFSLNFAALGYTAPQDLLYAYQLEGLSDKWTYVKRNRKVNFTKLSPGNYIFRVKAASSSGIWGSKQTTLEIEILPPWWASGWAFLAYAIIVIAAIYFALQYYHQRVEEKNRRKIERLEIAKEKELMQIEIAKEKEMLESKIEFYTQVAHEIRTPLTLIKIPLGKVIRKTTNIPEIENSLRIIGGNTDRLIELSNQLLDFRQTEIKAYSLSLEKANICVLLTNAHTNFITLAEQANIDLILNLPPRELYADIDVDAFTKIIYNLLSNAIKYAESTVTITLLLFYKDKSSFTIQVKNDGHLIPQHLKEKIFEPFFRIKDSEAKTGSGIGLALARSLAMIHNGSLSVEDTDPDNNTFSLTLPIYSS
ncbi:hypothetical protein GR160_09780 [Flavobacterium sp. Sd200]|uniref:ligand-binding sensor domain-containing protein n=1 Tax=Flavobacterium sp. Sd200 TaxID=2692211 RepID=UPI00137075BC|nr:sensor histidine kinase [Flavobacterium sp. Sd200]MXN91517.1 hypothetical protein [Flavobacterium sp. Sd200]